MPKRYQLSLFIFRRDLRLYDNTALLEALRSSEQVIACFIFDDQQIKHNDYFSPRAFTFMLQSLKDLEQETKSQGARLYFFKGNPATVVKKLLAQLTIDAVYVNADYTPFSQARDKAIEKIATSQNRDFHQCADLLLHEPGVVVKKDGKPYTVYTPFMKRSREIPVFKPQRNTLKNFYNKPIASAQQNLLKTLLKKYNEELIIPGGRVAAKKLLQRVNKLANYDVVRNLPAQDGTTHLSPHHKFGTLSIREVHHYIVKVHGASHTLINELYWRDFFTNIAFYFPHVFKGPFHEKYKSIKWRKSQAHFAKWCQGKTGFPIVDAGMRQLNATGYMHNRVRMITASFLVKDLQINWQWGERYFAQQLIDYDPAVNNGNWQWAASTGCDAQPYFRVFNPMLQQKRFDPDGQYIKKWLPELSGASHGDYPSPIVDHKTASANIKKLFKAL